MVKLEILISAPTDEQGRMVVRAIALLRGGDRERAGDLYRSVLAAKPRTATTWSNLAAFALFSGDVHAAHNHARRGLKHTPDCVDASVNLALAAIGKGEPDQALSILHKAVELQPRHATALANFGVLLAHNGIAAADDVLRRAAEQSPGSPRIAWERARLARTMGDSEATRFHALAALAMLTGALPETLVIVPRTTGFKVPDARRALCETQDLLAVAGIPFHLMAGTLLALVRDGDLMAHDKDIDLALPYGCDRDHVAALFERHPGFSVPSRPEVPAETPLWAFGVIHTASGVTIDLFFAKPEVDGVLFGFGLPPHAIVSRVRPYGLGQLTWQDRTWSIPAPPEQYLEDLYGPGWRTPDPYFDSALSNRCRTLETLPLAINLGLLRLCDTVENQDWLRARALCDQLLARGHFAEVAALARALRQRWPDPADE